MLGFYKYIFFLAFIWDEFFPIFLFNKSDESEILYIFV